MKIGILAVQGNFREHASMLLQLGAEPDLSPLTEPGAGPVV